MCINGDKIAEIIHFVVISMQSYNFISIFALTQRTHFQGVLRCFIFVPKLRRLTEAVFSVLRFFETIFGIRRKKLNQMSQKS